MVERSVSKYSINPRSDAYSLFIFAVKSGEFLEEGPDRKHYALAKKGETKLSQSALHWTKMMEMLELHLRRKRDTIVVILVVVAVISFAATYTHANYLGLRQYYKQILAYLIADKEMCLKLTDKPDSTYYLQVKR